MRNKLIMKYPSSYHRDMWRGGIPIGNGEIGALIYGGVYREIIAVNHAGLWSATKDMQVPDVGHVLQTMRELLNEKKPIEAETIMRDLLIQKGYQHETPVPIPLGDLTVTMNNQFPFTKYSRVLDMETGEAAVRWYEGQYPMERKAFVSRVSDTLCLKIVPGKSTETEIRFGVHDLETCKDGDAPENVTVICKDNVLKYAASDGMGQDFGAVVMVKTENWLVPASDFIRIDGDKEISVFVKVFCSGERNEQWSILEKGFSPSLNYDSEFEKHRAIHTNIYNAVQFNIGGKNYETANESLLLDNYQGKMSKEFTEKMWSFGRYLLVSAVRRNGYPCHLYGLWCGYYNPIWAFHMFNVNLEMIYWQAYSGNMKEALLGLFEHMESFMDDFRENAKKLYHCRGINIPSIVTPRTGLYTCMHPHILHWTGAAGWFSQLYYDYYLYTKDLVFLQNKAMPFMYETALFYEDFIIIENGVVKFSPSNSPENTPKSIRDELQREMEVVMNSTMDFAILKELLQNLLSGAEITGMYQDKVPLWKDILDKIPPYQVNEDSAIKEWMHPDFDDNYEHRHLSHIYPVFPGNEITAENPLFEAFKKAVDKRKTVGLRDQTGWSLTYMANIRARMGQGDEALECLNLMSRATVLDNFLTVHNDWRRMGIAICGDFREAPVQIDANMGFTAAIQEMLMMSTQTTIYAFHAMPEEWENGEAGPLLTKTNSSVVLKWDKNRKQASLHIVQGTTKETFQIILPSNMQFSCNLKNILDLTLESGQETVIDIIYHDKNTLQ